MKRPFAIIAFALVGLMTFLCLFSAVASMSPDKLAGSAEAASAPAVDTAGIDVQPFRSETVVNQDRPAEVNVFYSSSR